MAAYRYPLIKQDSICRPFVPIFVRNPDTNIAITINALVDTGADECAFPRIIADRTGHNLNGDGVVAHETKGVGGTPVICYKHSFEITLLTPDFKNPVWKSAVQLIDCADHNSIPPLLGYNNFLKYFSITFNYQQTEKNIIIHT